MADTERDQTTPTDGQALIRAFLEHSPFGRRVGLELKSLGEDRAELRLPFSEDVVTAGDVVHGGAISTLIDTAATAASWATTFDAPPQVWGTVSLTVDFVRGARAVDLVADARIVRRGGTLCFAEVSVTDPDQRVIAKGLATYRLG